jgi:hypothetical protein
MENGNFFSEKKPQYHNQYQTYEPDNISRANQTNFMSGSERGYPTNNNMKREVDFQKVAMAKMKRNKGYERR